VTTNWKKNTKKNTMKLKELSLLEIKEENKYYLTHREKTVFKKSKILLLKALAANTRSSRYTM
jgi:hypothetical protein